MSKLNSDLVALVARFEGGKPADPTENMSPEDAAKWQNMNDEHGDKFKTASDILQAIHRGDRVTITNRFGQEATGTAVMKGPAGWVLNMGGKHGTPAIASDDNIVKVKPAKRAAHVYLVGLNHNKEPMVDGHLDPVLMGMILTKITGKKVQEADPRKSILEDSPASTRTVSFGGILTTWEKALKAAVAEHEDMFAPAGRGAYRVDLNVGSIYEKAADEGDAKEGMFEKGKPADPTKDMSPEDAAEWKKNTEEHKDDFKKKAMEDVRRESLSVMSDLLDDIERGFGQDMFKQILAGATNETLGVTHKLSPLKQVQNALARRTFDTASRARMGRPGPREATMSVDAANWYYKLSDAVQATMARQVLISKAKGWGIVLDPKGMVRGSALDHLAVLNLELTAASLPGVPEAKAAADLDKDAEALEQVSHLAMLDRVADEMIGKIILDQMGGARRLQVMLGVQKIQFLPNGVGIKWPNKSPSKGNYVEIKLNGSDLYDVGFFNVSGMSKKPVKQYDDIYAEDLKDIFEKQTGWYLRMAAEQAHQLVASAKMATPMKKWDSHFFGPEDGKTFGDRRFAYVPFHQLSGPDQTKAKRQYPHKSVGAKYDFVDEHFLYPTDKSGNLGSARWFLAIPLAQIKDEDFMQSLGYTMNAGWPKAASDEGTMAKFEEGVSADPTKDMSPEDAAEWKKNTEEHKDKFKSAAGTKDHHEYSLAQELAQDESLAELKAGAKDKPDAKQLAHYKVTEEGWKRAYAEALNIAKEKAKKAARITTRADLVADGCPENLDEGECKEWEANTEKYKDVVKDQAKTAYEEGSRVPDGWDNGHIEGKPDTDVPGDEGSDVPDGNGNQQKRAGAKVAEVVAEMYALVTEDGYMLGATDDASDAHNKSSWMHTVDMEHFEAGAKLMTLVNVPLPMAEKFKDMGTTAQRFSDGYAAWDAAQRFSKGTGSRLAADKEAGTGLYGHTKRLQADCESCVRKVQKTAAMLARRAYGKHEGVAEFLSVHAKRAESLPAQILVSALGEIGPRVARQMRLAELRDAQKVGAENVAKWDALVAQDAKAATLGIFAQALWGTVGYKQATLADVAPQGMHFAHVLEAAESLKTAGLVTFDGIKVAKVTDADSQTGEGVTQVTDKTAKSYGLYGFGEKVASLGLQACTDLRHEAGKTAYDLHSRRTAHHGAINDFFANHSKQAKCMYSKLLSASYPDGPKAAKAASVPSSVQGWLDRA